MFPSWQAYSPFACRPIVTRAKLMLSLRALYRIAASVRLSLSAIVAALLPAAARVRNRASSSGVQGCGGRILALAPTPKDGSLSEKNRGRRYIRYCENRKNQRDPHPRRRCRSHHSDPPTIHPTATGGRRQPRRAKAAKRMRRLTAMGRGGSTKPDLGGDRYGLFSQRLAMSL
jgi:hypothetical protein